MSQETGSPFLNWVGRVVVGVGTALVVYWLVFQFVDQQQKQDGMRLSTYQELNTGMSEDTFVQTVGSLCIKDTEIADLQMPTRGYTCRGHGNAGSAAIFTFTGSVLASKTQLGLTD